MIAYAPAYSARDMETAAELDAVDAAAAMIDR
jgi:hypothetical protein